jgi:monoamine oxidase
MSSSIKRWVSRIVRSSRLTRREVLQAATAAMTLVSASPALYGRQKDRKIIVIGAGFSGLACAHELLAAGCQVTILEARLRVGGRVHSVPDLIPGKIVECGGELLGSNQPTVLAYAERFGLTFLDIPEHEELGPEPLILEGKVVPADEIAAAEPDLEKLTALVTNEAREIDAHQPWKSPEAERLDRWPTSQRIAAADVSPLAKRIFGVSLANDNTVSLDRQSYLGNLAQIRGGGLERYWTDSETCRCVGGNQQFATKLAEAIGSERVLLNCPVKRIEIGDRRVTVVDARGQKHEADDVVLTIPPSLWEKIVIDPKLPPLMKPQMGAAVKHLAVVNDKYWLNVKRPADSMGDGWIGYTWCGTDGQPSDAPEESLIAFTSGAMAKAISETQPASKRNQKYAQAFELHQPGFREAVQRSRFADWIQDPWTLAGYSFPAPGEVTTIGPFLHAGHGNRMHFAGEHTCYQFVGYMEGALNSGVATAKRMLARA